jgi:membrane fusion protein (multidrug efflux system)
MTWVRALAAALSVAAVVAAALWAGGVFGGNVRETDDAFVDGDIVVVSAEIPGRVEQLTASDNSLVQAGQKLVQIAGDDLRLKLDEAVAAQDMAQAQRDQLKAAGAAVTDAQRRGADAAVRAAAARTAQTKLALDKTQIVAPAAGYVARRVVSVGAIVQPGQPLLAIVGQKIWVTANFKETDLDGIQPGDTADLTVDAFPDLHLNGRVQSLQHGAGQAFSLLPAENASGNFVKVVQRIPVRIELLGTPERTLAPGMSVRVRVHVR